MLESKLRLVTRSEEDLIRVQSQIIDLARDTRQNVGSVGELYARVARSAKELGASQSDMLRVTKAVGQAIQISGSSAASAEAGMIQLSQALASGTLRGDELNSVLEQMPRVAEAIADGMGRTTEELRALGAEGKLTSEQVLRALISQTGRLNEEFRQLTPTVGQSMTVLRNEMKVATGAIFEATGTTNRLSNAIGKLAEAIRAIPKLTSDIESFFSRFRSGLDDIADRYPRVARVVDLLTKLSPLRIPWMIDDFLDGKEEEQYTRGGGPRRGRPPRATPGDAVSPVEGVRIDIKRIADDVPAHLQRMSEATRTEVERQLDSFRELKEALVALRSEGLISDEQHSARLSEGLDELLPEIDIEAIRNLYKPIIRETTEMGEFMKGVWQGVGQSIQQTMSDALYEWNISWKSLLDIARRALADILSAILTSGIKDALKSMTTSGGSSAGGFIAGLAGMFGFKAGGGNFDGPQIVGENGPEIVTGRGKVINARQMAFGGGQSINFAPVNTFNIIERDNPDKTRREMMEYVETRTSQQQAEFVRVLNRSGVPVNG